MFKRLGRNIVLFILLTASFCIVFISIISYNILKKNIYSNFEILSFQYISQQNQKFNQYKKLIEETSKLVSENKNIVNSIKTGKFDDTVIPFLNGMARSNLNIKGISIYGLNGAMYISNLINNPPSLEHLYENKLFRDFTLSSGMSIWDVRYRDISNFYDQNLYNKSRGLFTLFSKITDANNAVVGYLVLDTKISTIYDFFKINSSMFFTNSSSYIFTSEGSILSAPYSSDLIQSTKNDIISSIRFNKSYIYSHDKKHIVIFSKISSEDTVITLVPLNKIHTQFRLLKVIAIALASYFLILFFFASKLLSKSITQPLDRLYEKMQNPI